jgi:hypothetical protein
MLRRTQTRSAQSYTPEIQYLSASSTNGLERLGRANAQGELEESLKSTTVKSGLQIVDQVRHGTVFLSEGNGTSLTRNASRKPTRILGTTVHDKTKKCF